MKKTFGILISIIGIVFLFFAFDDFSAFWGEKNLREQVESLWKEDVQLLDRKKSFPKEWYEVSEIKYLPLSLSAKDLFSNITTPLKTNPEGGYRLEVSIDDWQDKNQYGLMIQYQLFDNKSENLIWELGRTFHLPTKSSDSKPSGLKYPDSKPSP